jgi:hypothetical protein
MSKAAGSSLTSRTNGPLVVFALVLDAPVGCPAPPGAVVVRAFPAAVALAALVRAG